MLKTKEKDANHIVIINIATDSGTRSSSFKQAIGKLKKASGNTSNLSNQLYQPLEVSAK
jgi:hypothetical protein